MTTPTGREPRPGFTPRGGQARPGSRGGDASWQDDAGWRGEERRGEASPRRPGRSNGYHDRGGRDQRGGWDGPDGHRPDAGPSFTPGNPGGFRGASGNARPDRGGGYGMGTPGRRPPAEPPRTGFLAIPGLRWIGRLPVGAALLLFATVVAAGTAVTIVSGHDPGFTLGFFIIAGSVVASAWVRRGAAHKFIPLPAMAYLVAATVAGLAHDKGSLNSKNQFALNFLTWIGGAFTGVVAATVLVIIIALSRWLLGARLVSGQLPDNGRPGPERSRDPRDGRGSPSGRDQWGGRDSRGNPDPWSNQGRPDERARRGDRGRRDDDPWADRASGNGRREPRNQPDRRYDRDPYDRRDPYDGWEDRGHRDPRDDRRRPNPPRDIW